jgi:hypothetical protein
MFVECKLYVDVSDEIAPLFPRSNESKNSSLTAQDWGTEFIRNFGRYLPIDTASHSRRPDLLWAPMREIHNHII